MHPTSGVSRISFGGGLAVGGLPGDIGEATEGLENKLRHTVGEATEGLDNEL